MTQSYPFFAQLARVINSGQARSILLWGNIHDMLFVSSSEKAELPENDAGSGTSGQGKYVSLVEFLAVKCRVPGITVLVQELNGPVRFLAEGDRQRVREAWVAWRLGAEPQNLVLNALSDRKLQTKKDELEARFDHELIESAGQPTVALEFLRQLTLCSRSHSPAGRAYLSENLLIIIEAADLLLPSGDGDIAKLNPADRHRVGVVQDWFSDPGFSLANDAVLLLTESRGLVHPRVARMPQVVAVEIPPPNPADRQHYLQWFMKTAPDRKLPPPKLWTSIDSLAQFTAGLSLHALRHLLLGVSHSGETLQADDVLAQVEEQIQSQLGEDVVEFKKPSHSLNDVVGFSQLKEFLRDELLPRFRSTGPDALPGAAVAGPIGGGKTFLFEAVAAALDLPVLVLKNIRSQWFGQTDVIFEKLRQVLEALQKVVIFVDEADTQFGSVGPNAHETERRLTGKIQQMMSDPRLRGRVIWLLMTARIHLLSADIRRPGRVGDLIIPVLDPEGEDRREFLRWVLKGSLAAATNDAPGNVTDDATIDRLDALTPDYSAAAFASLRSRLKAESIVHGQLTFERVEKIVWDQIPPDIGQERRYQTLQALVNCTRRSLLPDPNITEEDREDWQAEIRQLEAQGIG